LRPLVVDHTYGLFDVDGRHMTTHELPLGLAYRYVHCYQFPASIS
jgi:hypothetical protein